MRRGLSLALLLAISASSAADTTGLPLKGPAIHLLPIPGPSNIPAACAVLGQTCIWYDSNAGAYKLRLADGSDITPGSGVSLQAYTTATLPQPVPACCAEAWDTTTHLLAIADGTFWWELGVRVAPTPSGVSASPNHGLVGAPVTITGTGFNGVTAVDFNGTAASFSVVSSTQINTTVPAGATTGSIHVVNPVGTGTSSSFTVDVPGPTITLLSPNHGSVGSSTVITGTNFVSVTSVDFNGTATTIYNVDSPTQITATVPSGTTTGPVHVTSTVGTGTSGSNFTVDEGFVLDLTTSVPTWCGGACVSTTRSGNLLYVGNGAGAVVSVGPNTNIWEDVGDGWGGGLWVFDVLVNNAPNAFNMASGVGLIGGGVNTGWVHNNVVSFIADSSGNAFHGEKKGGITSISSPAGGAFGNALLLDGVTGTQVLLDGAIGKITTSAFNLSLFARPDAASATAVVIGKIGASSPSHQQLWINTNASHFNALATDGTNTLRVAAGTTALVNGTTYHVEVDFDGSTMLLFINGVQEGSIALTSGIVGAADVTPWLIGDLSEQTAAPFHGAVDEIRLKTVSVHRSNFSPPTSPYVADGTTKLLYHADSIVSGFSTGITGPDGSTNANRFVNATNKVTTYLSAIYAAGGVGDAFSPVDSVWVRNDATFGPASSGGLGATPFSSGSSAFGVLYNLTPIWHRAITAYAKSGTQVDGFVSTSSGAILTPAQKSVDLGGQTMTFDVTKGGATDLWGAQISSLYAEVPLVDGSSSAVTTTLHSSLLSRIKQANNDIHLAGSYSQDIANISGQGTVSDPRYIVSMDTSDGITGIRWNGVNAIECVVNGAGQGSTSIGIAKLKAIGIPSEVEWELWIMPSINKWGCAIKQNGGAWFSENFGGGLPTMHVPTALYLGSHGVANSYTNYRHQTIKSIVASPFDQEGLIVGDSQSSSFTTIHEALSGYIYRTLAQIRTRLGIASQALVGDVIGVDNLTGQRAKWHSSPWATSSFIKWVYMEIGINDANGGRTETQMAQDEQGFVDQICTDRPGIHIYLSPIAPCFPTCDWAGKIKPFNDDLAGTGNHNITCPGACTCIRMSSWDTPALLGDGTNTGTLKVSVDGGDHQHQNDLGQKTKGDTFAGYLQSNGDLP